MKTVYYLVHRDSKERVKYYTTLGGARIAQRLRNSHLGFDERISRTSTHDNWEVELCLDKNNIVQEATYCIVEDVIEQEDFTVYTN